MKSILKSKKKVFVLFLIILSFLLVCVYAFFNYELNNFQQKRFGELSESLNKLFEIKIEERQRTLSFLLDQMLNIEHLSKAVFEKDHKKIDSIVAPYYRDLKTSNHNILILTFRDKDNITLYRAHKAEFFGDSLSEKRKIIIDTNNLKQSFSGFEVGKLDITYRVTKPIFYKNEYVGCVEIGLDPKNILRDLSTIFKIDIGIVAKNLFLDLMSDRSVVYIGDRQFLLNRNEALENYFLNNKRNPDSYMVDTSLILKNHLLEEVGLIVVGFDFEDAARQYKEFIDTLFVTLVVFTTVFIMILFVVYKYFERFIFVKCSEDSTNMVSLNNELLKKEDLVPYFQPIVDRDGKTVKYEALMRVVNIQNNKERILLPYEFLEKSIKNDLYIDILKEMLNKSLDFFSKREEKISINFLPDDFLNFIIMDKIVELLKKFDSPGRVVVEISEKQSIDNFSKLFKIVKKLREMGVLISIDNYDGTYAENSHILIIKPDFIKIKGTLIKNVSSDVNSKNKVLSIINFTKELGIKTVAEFIEDEETFELLRECGVDEFQGYYFGYPMDLINKT